MLAEDVPSSSSAANVPVTTTAGTDALADILLSLSSAGDPDCTTVGDCDCEKQAMIEDPHAVVGEERSSDSPPPAMAMETLLCHNTKNEPLAPVDGVEGATAAISPGTFREASAFTAGQWNRGLCQPQLSP